MQSGLKLSLAAGAALLFLQAPVHAQGTAAISGQVTSEAEGAMEGVVVTARKADAKFSVSVVTDAQGRYSFPANRLEPGQYALTIRAIGYDLNGKASADVAGEKTARQLAELVPVRQVAGPHLGVPAAGLDLPLDLLAQLGLGGDQRDAVAVRTEPPGDRGPDAPARSGDDGPALGPAHVRRASLHRSPGLLQ